LKYPKATINILSILAATHNYSIAYTFSKLLNHVRNSLNRQHESW